MEVIQRLISPTKYAIKCPHKMEATRIVVHNTANDASADNEITYMCRNLKQLSFHFAIDDKKVIQGLPLDRNGWHAGDGAKGKGNREGIGIEICYSKSGGDRFIQAEKNAAVFIAQLLKERGWGIDRVTKHQDYDGKYCPHRTLDTGWQRFLDMILAEMGQAPAPKEDDFFPAKGYYCRGDRGEQVEKINDFFYRVFPGYAKDLGRNKKNLPGPLYGVNTQAWVKEFQKRTGLEPDGCFGPLTKKMAEKYGFKA